MTPESRTKPNPITLGKLRRARYPGRGESLGLQFVDTPQLIEQLDAGLSFRSLEALEENSGLRLGEIASLLGIPERTLSRRRSNGRLDPHESERLLRISTVFEKAVDLFEGDVEAAVRWLKSPKKALRGEKPIQYARTEPGGREVENLIGRLEHGVFS